MIQVTTGFLNPRFITWFGYDSKNTTAIRSVDGKTYIYRGTVKELQRVLTPSLLINIPGE